MLKLPKVGFKGLIWVAVALGIIALVLILIVVLLAPKIFSPAPEPLPPSSSSPRPSTQPADCPAVLSLIVPGTWESSKNDDPYNPTSHPRSLLLKVSKPLQERYSRSTAEVYTVPYVAEFQSPQKPGDTQYNTSRLQGYNRAAAKIVKTNKRCPLTKYVIVGFSQGAVIAGDLASNIGNGRGPLAKQDADLLLGVALIADGRREKGDAKDIGPNPSGDGAEVALSLFGGLVPGIKLNGPRNGGFGDVRDRVVQICAPGDLICDAPSITNPIDAITKVANATNNPVHAGYAGTKYWQLDGQPATTWVTEWARELIDSAPR